MAANPKMSKFIVYEANERWFDIEDHPALYYCQFSKNSYSDDLFAYYRVEFPEQLKNAVIKRRAEFLAGRYCASKVLMQQGITESTIGIGAHRNPLWPSGVRGTISHCNENAVAAICRTSNTLGIGIDIEELASSDTVKRLQSQIFYGQESLLLADERKTLIFTLAFSVKESFFKAAYPTVRKYFNFDSVSIVNIDFKRKKIALEINVNLGENLKKGKLVFGYFCYLSASQVATLVCL